ncbi:LEA type 2 family protein [Dysgonomonas macrotermitis]|uniref:Late embryogenesis abundant protein n=1 Tax=Dysgonomonas macrotermitis TaxID=1346286 RepID=A0A1M5EDY0_9BACT|nr:LEA type 2 family protein [Dysgonomonas macrotermitis]SHF77439.1 Late embryogenesis abundant protein [Dysgonomonas macrotermitis]
MNKKILSLVLFVSILFSGCGTTGNSLSSAYNLTQCEYEYKNISNLTVSGMNLSNGISATNLPKLISILGGTASSIPMNFTLNLDIKNPNTATAALNGLQYVISIDDIQFTTGQVNQALNIAGGSTQTLPLNIGVDLATLMTGDSKNAVQNIAKNFIGIGSQQSNVKVQLKPTFVIAGQSITSPVAIPVSFTFGGK